jgi:SAM-dependent methyltransferase
MQRIIFIYIWVIILNACVSDAGKKGNTTIDNENAKQEKTTEILQDDSKNRDVWQHPEYIINLMGDISDKSIADIGAGSGYFSFKLLPKAKKVIAIDIDQRFIKFMNQKVALLPVELKSKFEARLATSIDPKLTENEAQVILIVNTYIYINNRVRYFTDIRKKLSNMGKILIVDFKNIDLPVGPPKSIKLSGNNVVQELQAAGFKNVVLDNNSLDYQYIVTAENINN